MNDKIQKSISIIKSGLSNTSSQCLAWSGGKDSMALLHLVYIQCGIRIPIIFFREQWQPHKYEFQNRIIEKYGLEVYSWHPLDTAMQQTDNEFEVQNLYNLSKFTMTCPTGITPPEAGKPWTCGLDILNRPKQEGLTSKWDGIFIGHKGCDSDPIYGGDAGTRIETRVIPNQDMTVFFPLRDWTHDDVFQYCEDYDIPIQENRYEKFNGQWIEREDKTYNADYVHACTLCLDKRENAAKYIECPKYNCIIENVSDKVKWTDQEKISYMKD